MSQGEGGGRPRVDIDWHLVVNLLKIQCIGEEIAASMNISYDSLERRCKEDHGQSFAEWSSEKREGGKPSLRRAQWKKAVDDMNPTMLIWLGKQMLGQSDKVDQRVTSPDGSMTPKDVGPVAIYSLPDNGRDKPEPEPEPVPKAKPKRKPKRKASTKKRAT